MKQQFPLTKCYRNGSGVHQKFYDELRKHIPKCGRIPSFYRRPALERLRKAANIYYDLYNYNLVNYHASCFGILGLKYSEYMIDPDETNNFCRFKLEFYEAVENKMDEIITKAYRELEYFKTL